jgi:hypothetical protein
VKGTFFCNFFSFFLFTAGFWGGRVSGSGWVAVFGMAGKSVIWRVFWCKNCENRSGIERVTIGFSMVTFFLSFFFAFDDFYVIG